ncbi:hypothetical protein LZ31DRAFT_556636 [Colletotrichum somersetense]|nr:hypothetical protein LZ31DRAFT_556636 [Colletotrichum somersetense]
MPCMVLCLSVSLSLGFQQPLPPRSTLFANPCSQRSRPLRFSRIKAWNETARPRSGGSTRFLCSFSCDATANHNPQAPYPC